VAYVLAETGTNTPAKRPSFIGAMVTSWTSILAWAADLATRMAPDYEGVSAADLAALYHQAPDGRGASP